MRGFILAAGFGERLKPLTDRVPKPLIPVAGIPAICYSLALLKKYGIEEVVCNLHYHHDKILAFFHRYGTFGFKLKYVVEEEIRGTGGGLKGAEGYLKEEDFILINSDIIADLNIGEMVSRRKEREDTGVLALFPSDGKEIPGTVSVAEGMITDINGLAGSGVPPRYDYMGAAFLSPGIFPYLKKEFSCIVQSAFLPLTRKKKLGYYLHDGFWYDMGSHEKLQKVENFFTGEGSSYAQWVREILRWKE